MEFVVLEEIFNSCTGEVHIVTASLSMGNQLPIINI